MKLQNRKTGEIKEWDFGNWYQHILNPDNKESFECTLSEFIDRTVEFREEWKDYKEPKEFWFVDADGEVRKTNYLSNNDKSGLRNFGNYFDTREEAEKAVEKLKAWKRLKDKGFRFERWYWDDTQGHYILEKIDFVMDEYDGAEKDLDLLFGGGE